MVEPFTPAGVTAKQEELNGLSSADRQTQADLISSDFRSWINDNFDLSEDQQTYLTNMADQFISYAANLTSFAVVNELTIGLAVEPQGTKTFKLIHVTNNIDCVTSPDGFSVTGGVNYAVDWQ